MTKPPKKPKTEEEIETVPDAWEQFEDAIGQMVPPRWKVQSGKASEEKPDKGGDRRQVKKSG